MDGTNYFIQKLKPERQDVPSGILTRQRLIVSNAVSVSGMLTCIGVPEWSENHDLAKHDANVVSLLMQSGCHLIGKAQDDDFGTSISGENPFLARLIHPLKAGLRIGGSASGCAVSVARGEASIAIANDCCGGVLIPAANCHLFGYRPSSGMVDLRGIASLAPSFDAIGFMSKKLPTLQQIAEKCWKEAPQLVRLKGVRYASSFFQELLPLEAMLEWEVTMSLLKFERNEIKGFNKIILNQAHKIHTILLGREVDLEYGAWLEKTTPRFSDETSRYLAEIRGKSFKEFVETKKKRGFFSDTLISLLTPGEILLIPTTPGPAPEVENVTEEYLLNQRKLCAIAEVAGLAQLTIPYMMIKGAPMGISLLALPGEDKLLFEAAGRWFT